MSNTQDREKSVNAQLHQLDCLRGRCDTLLPGSDKFLVRRVR